jgi:hypothetical protein
MASKSNASEQPARDRHIFRYSVLALAASGFAIATWLYWLLMRVAVCWGESTNWIDRISCNTHIGAYAFLFWAVFMLGSLTDHLSDHLDTVEQPTDGLTAHVVRPRRRWHERKWRGVRAIASRQSIPHRKKSAAAMLLAFAFFVLLIWFLSLTSMRL